MASVYSVQGQVSQCLVCSSSLVAMLVLTVGWTMQAGGAQGRDSVFSGDCTVFSVGFIV